MRELVPLNSSPAAMGTVTRLWRYPVKSMLGEACPALEVNARGVVGDRLFAIRTAEGKLGSGKSTRRFRHIDGLFGFHAIYQGDTPLITFPDGRTLRGDDPALDVALTELFNQPVTLAREAAISHLDVGPVHLVTTAALRWLQSRLPDAVIDERRFRPNLVVDVLGTTQVEHQWCGATLAIGDTVQLQVDVPTERCGMVSFAQADLPKEPGVLRSITHEADLLFGVYAQVLVPGRILRGDPVRLVR